MKTNSTSRKHRDLGVCGFFLAVLAGAVEVVCDRAAYHRVRGFFDE